MLENFRGVDSHCICIDIDQALISHTQMVMGVPQKTFDHENLKFGLKFSLKFSVLATITSGLVGVTSQNIFHTTCRESIKGQTCV